MKEWKKHRHLFKEFDDNFGVEIFELKVKLQQYTVFMYFQELHVEIVFNKESDYRKHQMLCDLIVYIKTWIPMPSQGLFTDTTMEEEEIFNKFKKHLPKLKKHLVEFIKKAGL